MVLWDVPIFVMFPTFHNFIEVIPIEAMEPVKEPSSQESQPPAVPEAALPSTTTSTPPTTETVSAEELELLWKFRASSSRTTSPPKKEGQNRKRMEWFPPGIVSQEHRAELSDLDYSPQQELQASEQARIGFLAFSLTTPDTTLWSWTRLLPKVDLTKKRPFKAIQSIELPTLEVQESQIKDAMMQCHENTFMPNHACLLEACKQFYTHASLEQYDTNIQLDTIDTRLKTLDAKLAINLSFFEDYQPLDSPRTTSSGILSTFVKGLTSPLIRFPLSPTTLSIQTPAFLGLNSWETLRNKFFTYAKANRLEWGFNQKRCKVKIEADVNSSDSLAR